MTAVPAHAPAAQHAHTLCAHCDLPVPAGLIEPGEHEQYCCSGCRLARIAITSAGLESYYAVRRRVDRTPARSTTSGSRFTEFDHASFADAHVHLEDDGSATCELYLEGVHCAACVWLVERLPRAVPGVREARLDLGRSLVRLRWNPQATTLSRAAEGLDRLGYRPHVATAEAQRRARRHADRASLIRIGVAGACAGNVMLLAATLYSGMLDGIDESTRTAFRLLSAAIGVLCVAWPGRVFFLGALGALRARSWHLDMPIALALGVGSITGVINAITGRGEVYFDSVTMLVFLLLVGRWLQASGVRAAADALDLLSALTPGTAHLIDADGTPRDVPTASLKPGDTIELRPGEPCPVDGLITQGSTRIDASVITGESRPTPATHGDPIAAGAVNAATTVQVRALAVGRDTRLGPVMQTIERLGRERVPLLGRADRIAGPFVIGVTILAALCIALWARSGIGIALEHATALLIVACPCALALATPLVSAAAIGRAARAGILIKGADTLERFSTPGVVILDKTGTLTEGRFQLLKVFGDDSLLPLAAALERDSSHPIAAALAELSDELHATHTEHLTGQGVLGTVAALRVAVGQMPFVAQHISANLEDLARQALPLTREGATPCFVASSDGRRAVIMLGDRIRDDAPALLAHLRRQGWHIRMVSGDAPATAQAVGQALALAPDDIAGGVSPEDKLATVEHALKSGPVLMVGDGVNDAAALARATVGIAVHGGAEASLAAADVYLTTPSLSSISALIDGSNRAVRAIRRCMAVSLAYNSIAAALALAGLVTPLLAAILMPISSLTVIILALTARTFPGARR